MKSILVLEGGALRGIYTAGLLDFFMDKGIRVDSLVGVSAGALFGFNYISNQRGRCIGYNLDYCDKKEYMGFHSWLTTGNIMNKETCFNEIVYKTYPVDFEAFNKSKTKFYCVVTNVETGKAEYINIKNLEEEMEYLRASGSMPIVSKIVNINGKKYLDGAVGDSIPLKWALDNGYDRVIVVRTRYGNYRKKKSLTLPYKILYHKYPKFMNNAINRYKDYNDTLDYIENMKKDKRVLVLEPSKFINVKRIERDKKKIKDMYDLGYEDTKNRYSEICKFLDIE